NLYGTSFADDLRGDGSNNSLWGAAGDDVLYGRAGNDSLFGMGNNDTIYGQGGNDTIWGGAGVDQFMFENGFGNDRIMDFDVTNTGEKINLSSILAINDYLDLDANHLQQSGRNAMIYDGAGNTITLIDVNVSELTVDHFVF
ncbi:calcium-binding protein, partial [Sulfitobacter sp.]|uniref:calcium-binding protein n=1 Tax=Sulfitobacter sp. TaxID=1903071 RepID=UPI003B5D836D